MDYKKKLQSLCEDIDGAVATFFSGYDGMLIEHYTAPNVNYSMEELAASWADVLSKLIVKENMLTDFIATFDQNIVAIKPIGENGFVGIVMTKEANVGRAKFELNKLRSGQNEKNHYIYYLFVGCGYRPLSCQGGSHQSDHS